MHDGTVKTNYSPSSVPSSRHHLVGPFESHARIVASVPTVNPTRDILQSQRSDTSLTDVDNFNAFIFFEKSQAHRHVLQLLRAEVRSPVQLGEFLSAEHLDERNETQTVGQVELEVGNVLVDQLQMLVRPPRERVLLNQLPLRILGQLAFRRHVLFAFLVVIVAVRVVVVVDRRVLHLGPGRRQTLLVVHVNIHDVHVRPAATPRRAGMARPADSPHLRSTPIIRPLLYQLAPFQVNTKQ